MSRFHLGDPGERDSFPGPQCSIYKPQLVANKICASTTNCQLKRLKVQSRGGQDSFQGAEDFAYNLPSPTWCRGTLPWGENHIPDEAACKAERAASSVTGPLALEAAAQLRDGPGSLTFPLQNVDLVYDKYSHPRRARQGAL